METLTLTLPKEFSTDIADSIASSFDKILGVNTRTSEIETAGVADISNKQGAFKGIGSDYFKTDEETDMESVILVSMFKVLDASYDVLRDIFNVLETSEARDVQNIENNAVKNEIAQQKLKQKEDAENDKLNKKSSDFSMGGLFKGMLKKGTFVAGIAALAPIVLGFISGILEESFPKIYAWIEKKWPELKEKLLVGWGYLETGADKMGEFFEWLGLKFKNITGIKTEKDVDDLWTRIIEAPGILIDWFESFGVAIGETIAYFTTGNAERDLDAWSKNLWVDLKELVNNLWTTIVNSIEGMYIGAMENVTEGWTSVKTMASDAWNTIVNSITGFYGNTVDAITEGWTSLKQLGSDVWNTIVSSIKGFLVTPEDNDYDKDFLSTIINDAITSIKTLFKEMFDFIPSWADLEEGFYNTIPAWIKNLKSTSEEQRKNDISNLDNEILEDKSKLAKGKNYWWGDMSDEDKSELTQEILEKEKRLTELKAGVEHTQRATVDTYSGAMALINEPKTKLKVDAPISDFSYSDAMRLANNPTDAKVNSLTEAAAGASPTLVVIEGNKDVKGGDTNVNHINTTTVITRPDVSAPLNASQRGRPGMGG